MGEMPAWLKEGIKARLDEKMPAWLKEGLAVRAEEQSPTPITKNQRGFGLEGDDVDEPVSFVIPKDASRGIRNNNPGNIETGAKWQGVAKDEDLNTEQKGESRFVVFESPEFGIRSITKIMQTYRTKHGLSTVRGIINRWAPPFENNTDAYVDAVAEFMGVGPDDRIDTTNPKILLPLVSAIIKHENGVQPYSESTIMAGISLAFPNKEG